MTEREEDRKFVERDLSRKDGEVPTVIFERDKYTGKRRNDNRKMIERGRGINIEDITQVSSMINIQGRRTRGGGRRVKPKT